jgi:hypothetical protein
MTNEAPIMIELSRARRFALLLATTMSPLPALAADLPFHVAASLGRTEVGDVNGVSIDDSATAFRLSTGYRFVSWLGLEGAYVNLGTLESSVEFAPGTTAPVEASADGFEMAAVVHIPVSDKLAATAQAGVLWWNSDTRIGSTGTDDSGNDFAWGVGVEYAIKSTFAVDGGWRRYAVDEVDADTIWIGVQLRFGDAE